MIRSLTARIQAFWRFRSCPWAICSPRRDRRCLRAFRFFRPRASAFLTGLGLAWRRSLAAAWTSAVRLNPLRQASGPFGVEPRPAQVGKGREFVYDAAGSTDMRITATLAALSGLAATALGTFAAHGLSDPQAKAWSETAFEQQGLHTMACFAALWLSQQEARLARFAPAFFLVGIALFCGALYALAFGAPKEIAIAAPIGGVSFMLGWCVLAAAALSLRGR